MKRGMGSPNFDRSKQHAISSRGGKAAHAQHKAHEWTAEEARKASDLAVTKRLLKTIAY